MSSLFYNALGKVLIARGVNCLVGPQLDVPPIFAREYAKAFFAQLAAERVDEAPRRAGDIFHQLTVEGVTNCKNPLVLMMSLYRGIDSHICLIHRQEDKSETDVPTCV